MKVRSVDRGVSPSFRWSSGSGSPRALLAKVVQPERLKAVLRIPGDASARFWRCTSRPPSTRATAWCRGRSPGFSFGQSGLGRGGRFSSRRLPRGARPDLTSKDHRDREAQDVLFVGRPAGAQAGGQTELFKIVKGGDERIA